MSEPKGAARRTDLINHGKVKGDRTAKIAKAALEAAKTAYTVYRIAKLGAAFVPGVGWGALAASFVVDWAVSKAIDKAAEYFIEKKFSGEPEILVGSPDTFVNKLNSARGKKVDPVKCTPGSFVEQGSRWVSINSKPAARLKDMTDCPGHIDKASENVAIGGPQTYYNPDQNLDRALFVLSLYNKMKVTGITAAVNGESVAKAMGSAVGKGLAKQAWKEGTQPVKQSIKESLQDSGYLPW